jgi:uncharacterized protein
MLPDADNRQPDDEMLSSLQTAPSVFVASTDRVLWVVGTKPYPTLAVLRRGLHRPELRIVSGPEGVQAAIEFESVAAKWKALLFMAGVLLLIPLAQVPANWLTARGLLQERAAWAAAMHWSNFLAVLVPTTVAAWLEGQPVWSFGLAWRAGRGRLLAEGVAWGGAAAGILAGVLLATGLARAHGLTLGEGEAIRSGATWALALLGMALFEQSLKHGYLQCILGRALGFWQAAWLLSVLFTLEKLPSVRNPLELTSFLVSGLFACLTLRRTGDLWFAVGLQTGLEWSMVFLFGMGLWLPTLGPPGTLMRVDMQGPVWLSGGRDGIYASAFFLALVVILAWGVQRRFPSSRGLRTPA